ncbi:2414_t:CDS:2 [Acaulospora colombiana]|uniref:2414_t:CDS:1 n=1 Tax=Acaulospora colombiana TaxID=27376 RepID=A0ACA9NBQ3_9GLOM|nr:2414_t:CDS:2 [Acaulospora colombiana]
MQATSSFPLSSTNDSLEDLQGSGTGRNTPSLSNPLSSLFPPVSSSTAYLDSYQQHHQIPQDLDALAAAFPEFDSVNTNSNNNQAPLHNLHSNNASLAGNDLNWFLPSSTNESIAPAASLPAPDQFDEDLERALADLGPAQLNWLNTLETVDFTQHQFSYHRGGTLSHPGGPLSVITASSESAYNGIGDDGRSESYYNPYSPQGSLVNAANPSQLNPSLYQALENFSADLAAFGLGDNNLNSNPALLNGTSIQPAQTTAQATNGPNPIQPPTVNLDLLMPSSTASYSSFDDSGNSARDTSPNDHLLHHRLSSDEGAAAIEMEREFGTSTNLLSAAAQFAQDESGLKMANSGGGSSAASTYGVSGHPLPHVNAHASAGRIHHVGNPTTTGGAPKGQKGSTTPTNAAASASFVPNIAIGSSNANIDRFNTGSSAGGSFMRTQPSTNATSSSSSANVNTTHWVVSFTMKLLYICSWSSYSSTLNPRTHLSAPTRLVSSLSGKDKIARRALVRGAWAKEKKTSSLSIDLENSFIFLDNPTTPHRTKQMVFSVLAVVLYSAPFNRLIEPSGGYGPDKNLIFVRGFNPPVSPHSVSDYQFLLVC